MKNCLKILSFWFTILISDNGICQTSLTENTADEIHIAANVEWSDWGSNYTNGNGGNVRNYGTFIFYGNKFTNNGTYRSSAGSKDSFINTFVDTISGTNRPRFYDLILSTGSNNFIINNDSGIEVAHNINFASSIVSTKRSNVNIGSINFIDNATYTGTMSNTKFVDGYVTKKGNDAFVFPVGNSNKYHPLTISSPSSLLYQLSVSYFYDNPATADLTGGAHSLSSLASPLTSVDNTQFWDVVTSSTDSISVTLHLESLVGKYFNASSIKMVGWNIADARWEVIGDNIPSGLTSGNTISNDSINLSRYSAIGIGSTLEVLPVELLNLSVRKIENKKSLIQWTTASEKNNSKFIVERSVDLNTFFAIGEQLGSISSNAILNYSIVDEEPFDGTNYYRLKQVNLDGSFTYSSILAIDFTDNDFIDNQIKIELRNSNTQATLLIQSSINANLQISLFTLDGKLIKQPEIASVQASSNQEFEIDTANLDRGIYFISVLNLSTKRDCYFKFIK